MMTYPFNSLHLAKAEWINGIFTRIDHNLSYEINIKEHESTEIIPSIFSDHIGIQVEISGRKKKKKTGKILKLMLINTS